MLKLSLAASKRFKQGQQLNRSNSLTILFSINYRDKITYLSYIMPFVARLDYVIGKSYANFGVVWSYIISIK